MTLRPDSYVAGEAPAGYQSPPSGGPLPELTIRQVCDWARLQAVRLARGYGLTDEDRDLFLLAQTVKLGEEVGELHAEVLGRTRYQRAAKADQYSAASLAGGLADVTICVAILSEMLGADLGMAIRAKIAGIEARA